MINNARVNDASDVDAIKQRESAFAPPSDHLAALRDVLEILPLAAAHLPKALSLRLVFDANVVIGEVRWMATRRQKTTARTALLEALASGTVVGFAPVYLQREVIKELEAISLAENIALELLFAEWDKYRCHLRFIDTGAMVAPPSALAVDPKDVPYLLVYDRLGAAAILTDDPHLTRMGARTARGVDVSIALRDYARATTVQLTLKLNGVLLATIGVEALCFVAKAIKAGIEKFQKLPVEVRIIIACLVAAALLHEPTRERLKQQLMKAWRHLTSALEAVAPVYSELSQRTKRAEVDAQEAWSKVATRVKSRHASLRAHVLALCVGSKRPLSEEQLTMRLAELGVQTSAATFPRSLRRALRSHPDLVEIAARTWAVKASPSPSRQSA